MIARRTVAAEQKIAQAEGQAIAEVKARASDLAIEAARAILSKKVTGAVSEKLLSESIDAVKTRLN
jgi:F-type H+-transporting ATPase subunit b